MVQFVILHAAEDSDRAQALARQTPDGAGLPALIPASKGPAIDPNTVRVALWSSDAAPFAAEFAAAMAGGIGVVVTFDSTPLDARINAVSHSVVDAAGDAVSTGRAMCAAAAVAIRAVGGLSARRLGADGSATLPIAQTLTSMSRPPSSRPVARPARRSGFFRRAALATTVGAGATAISLASVAGYAANEDLSPLQISAPSVSASAMRSSVASAVSPVRAHFDGSAMTVDIHTAALAVSPTAADEITVRVEASLQTAREGAQAQLTRFEELQRISARVSRVAPVAVSVGADAANLPIITISAVRTIPLELSGDRFAELAALEPVV